MAPGTLNQAKAHHSKQELVEAEVLYRAVLVDDGLNVEALHGLGMLCYQTGRLPEAAAMLEGAIAVNPGASASFAYLCLVRRDLGELHQAVAAARRSLELHPNNAEFINVLGRLYQDQDRRAEAIEQFRRAVKLKPDYVDAYHNLAIGLESSGRSEEALVYYGRAIELAPDNGHLHYNLSLSQLSLSRFADALQSTERVLVLSPQHLPALYSRAYLRRFLCDWREIEQHTADLEAALLTHVQKEDVPEIAPYALNIVSVSKECHRAVATRYAKHVNKRLPAGAPPFDHVRRAPARLRIAYVSADFREHAVGLLVHQLFAYHDREKVRVHAYSLHASSDAYQQSVRAGVDVFRDLSAVPALEAARQIYRDEIDVLVDLTGFTWGSRPEILALRPAPVQLSYLGYLNTMSADFIDYIVADHTVLPPEHERYYTETVIRLPSLFMPMPELEVSATVPSRESLGLPADGFVFASFNNPYKLEPRVFTVWMEILQAVPGSVLWVYTADVDEARENLLQFAGRHGVRPDRLVFAPTVPLPEHIARLYAADLFLDSFSYNAGASAAVALQAGLPILTCLGDTFLTRMSASVNRMLGFNDLICAGAEDYQERAIQLARSQDVQRRRLEIKKALQSGAWLNLETHANLLEQAYYRAWSQWRERKLPQPINL